MHRLKIDKNRVFLDGVELLGKTAWQLKYPPHPESTSLAKAEIGELKVTLLVKLDQEEIKK